MHFTAGTSSNGVRERDFTVGEIPGVLWSPESGPDRAPLVLMGHGGGTHKQAPAMAGRAHLLVTGCGFHVAAIDAPGHGDRPRTAQDEREIAELYRARAAGEPEGPIIVRYNTHLAERAVPEWRATLDALQLRPVRARLPGRGGEADHHSDRVRAPVGRRAHPAPVRPGVVRRLRLEGEDAARQRGRTHGTAQIRGRQRGPILRPPPRPSRHITGLT
ncbi:alpha/beta fold hydrolase [Actinomadura formosensis]|uniref:hypothetical protein n=1 Tax=Actinomadura formosensis TaxID=60706 RepID=UPI000B2289F2|nr:hypothetical protein [Actinomadura formosensis]